VGLSFSSRLWGCTVYALSMKIMLLFRPLMLPLVLQLLRLLLPLPVHGRWCILQTRAWLLTLLVLQSQCDGGSYQGESVSGCISAMGGVRVGQGNIWRMVVGGVGSG
jgi:hypothetical protein